jgi:hypothetical protein
MINKINQRGIPWEICIDTNKLLVVHYYILVGWTESYLNSLPYSKDDNDDAYSEYTNT